MNKLHGRQRRVAVEQVHALERHAQRAVLQRQVVEEGADVELQFVALRLGVVELGAHHELARRHRRLSTVGVCSRWWQRLGGCCEKARGLFSRSMRSSRSSLSSYMCEVWLRPSSWSGTSGTQ